MALFAVFFNVKMKQHAGGYGDKSGEYLKQNVAGKLKCLHVWFLRFIIHCLRSGGVCTTAAPGAQETKNGPDIEEISQDAGPWTLQCTTKIIMLRLLYHIAAIVSIVVSMLVRRIVAPHAKPEPGQRPDNGRHGLDDAADFFGNFWLISIHTSCTLRMGYSVAKVPR